MEYRRLGKTGLKVSTFALGTWITVKKETDKTLLRDIIAKAIELGVNTLDTAEGYASGDAESQLGEVLKKGPWDRTDLVIMTKIFFGTKKTPNATGLSFKHIVEGLDASLARLQLKYVDVVFCHRPDPEVPIEETVRAMTHVINQGKAFYWGTSEWSASQISEAYGAARQFNLIPPCVEQPQYNMFHRDRVEAEYAPLYPPSGAVGLGTTIWSPLAYGLLTGKYNDGIPAGSRLENEPFFKETKEKLSNEEGQKKIDKVKKLSEIAKEIGATTTQLALAWAAKNTNVSTVILGATSVKQVEENVASLQFVSKITPEVNEKIEAILGNKPAGPRKLR